MSRWLLWIGSLLLLVAFFFLLQGIWSGITQNYNMTPYGRAKMTGAVGFAMLVLGWILKRRGK
jgi:uncharacterized membrane-anchored protein